MRLCLDTSGYSQFRRGHEDVTALLDRAGWVGVPTVVLGELVLGFALGSRHDRNERELTAFLEHPRVEALSVDREVAEIWGRLMAALRRAGKPVPLNDVWIAATAVRHGADVVTFDPHFERIPRVGLRLQR